MPEKKCPKCGVVGDIQICFGYRKVPHLITQSWCRECRNKKPVSETLAQRAAKAMDRNFDRIISGNATPKEEITVTRSSNDQFKILAVGDNHSRMSTNVTLAEMTREELVSLYCRWYPGDKANKKRSAKFMAARLSKKMEATAL